MSPRGRVISARKHPIQPTTKHVRRGAPMQEIVGTSNKVLEVNLSTGDFAISEISDKDRRMYLGGKGLGLKLLYDRMETRGRPAGRGEHDRLHARRPHGHRRALLGPLRSGDQVPAHRHHGDRVVRRPLRHGAQDLRLGRDDHQGKSEERPLYLSIDSKGVQFKPAKDVWGKDTQAGADRARKGRRRRGGHRPRGREPGQVRQHPLGPPVPRAGRHGRGHGLEKPEGHRGEGRRVQDRPGQEEEIRESQQDASSSTSTRNAITVGLLPELRHQRQREPVQRGRILPVRNFTGGSHGEAHKISGEAMADRFNTKYDTCKPCAIMCGHKGTVNGKERHIPEYETIGPHGLQPRHLRPRAHHRMERDLLARTAWTPSPPAARWPGPWRPRRRGSSRPT